MGRPVGVQISPSAPQNMKSRGQYLFAAFFLILFKINYRTSGVTCQKVIEEIVLSAHSSMLRGTRNIRMDARQWGLKPNNCQVLSYFNPLENHVRFLKKKH